MMDDSNSQPETVPEQTKPTRGRGRGRAAAPRRGQTRGIGKAKATTSTRGQTRGIGKAKATTSTRDQTRGIGKAKATTSTRGQPRGRGRPSKKATANLSAESDTQPLEDDSSDMKRSKSGATAEEADVCPVCLDPPVHIIKLECQHAYCFLCAKGLSESGNPTCSLCRSPIAPDFFKSSELLKRRSLVRTPSQSTSATNSNTICWFYEGGRGWWRFEERHNEEIETAFQNNMSHIELLICGQIYFVNLMAMTQFRRDLPMRVRKIKRGTISTPAVGIAGLVSET